MQSYWCTVVQLYGVRDDRFDRVGLSCCDDYRGLYRRLTAGFGDSDGYGARFDGADRAQREESERRTCRVCGDLVLIN